MKRSISLLIVIALGLLSLNAITITAGSVTEGIINFPIRNSYSYNYTQQIYTQSQINYQGQIQKIRFYNYSSGSMGNSHNWAIYMGHVTRSSFSSTTDWEAVANLTQVFSGSILDNYPPSGQWMEITLDTPFDYNNTDNLLVAVYENTPRWGSAAWWGGFTCENDEARGLCYFHDSINPDINNPPTARNLTAAIAAMQMIFPDTGVPMAPQLLSPENNASIMNNQVFEWALPHASPDATGFDVYIDGAVVSADQAETQYTIGGLAAGTHTWYVVARNSFGTSAPSETRTFNIPSGVIIGDGTANNYIPVSPNFYHNYSQSIFLQSEINTGNQRIESISYYWNGAGVGTNTRDWVIYMGHVQRSEFASRTDWVPLSQMEQVFAGQVDIPAVLGWIEIELDFPFAYNNTDNLVIAVCEYTNGYDGEAQYFYSTPSPGQIRSLRCYRNTENPDPGSPPDGAMLAAYPNIVMRFGDFPTSPILRVTPPVVDFGLVMHGETNEPQIVLATNIGGGTLNLSAADISIIGPNAAEFFFDPTNLPAALTAGQNVQIPVALTGLTAGEINATLRVVYEGQNYDVALTADVLPAGTVIIGDGMDTSGFPFGIFYDYERSATLYTAAQIGPAGYINTIAWDCATTSDAEIPYKIWAKNTTQTTLSSQTWHNFTSDATLVKEGIHIPNTLGWQMFQLDVPFAYTGAGLIIGVEINYGSTGAGGAHRHRYTDTNDIAFQYWFQDLSEPMGNGQIISIFPNLMLQMSSDIESDLDAVSITGNITPTVGQEVVYTVRLRNNGNEAQDTYNVKLMGPNDTVLATVAGPALNSMQTVDVGLPWTPTTVDTISIYGKVELAGDEIPQNNQTNQILVNVQPEGVQAITVGSGIELAPHPINFDYSCSIYETLYMADELGLTTGTITSLAIYNQFSDELYNYHGPTKVYLGSTTLNNLRDGFISASELTLVYDGFVSFPVGENTITITLQSPYLYTGGNLVMMFQCPMRESWNDAYFYFRCQTEGDDRARYAYSDYIDLDPYNLPVGAMTGQFPQVTFFYTPDLIANDLGLLHISGNYTPSVGQESVYTLRLRNNGTANQDTYTLKLLDPNEVELASLAGPAINSQQILEVAIPWTPTTEDITGIYGQVVLDGDQIAVNNQTALLAVDVQPEGVHALTVGNGDQLARMPVDFFYYHSLYEALFYPDEDELNGFIGHITGLRFYNNFYSSLPNMPISIWLGTTTQTTLADGFIPSTQLTPVYDGPVNFYSGQHTINIVFDEPYPYTGDSNLVMMVHKADTNWHGLDDYFRCQTGETERSILACEDDEALDPAAPPFGILSAQFPQTTFVVVPCGMGHISGTVTNANNQPLSGATVSLNDGTCSTTTDDQGQYQLINVWADTYTLNFSAHGYYGHTQTIVLEDDDDLTINATLQPLPTVSVTGTVLASNTGAGIPDALIRLSGYESYSATTNAAGVFTIPTVYAERTYDYNISAYGYTSTSGQVVVGVTNHNLGEIALEELAFAPTGVVAVENDSGDSVEITWLPPGPDALEVIESFEGATLPPEGWTQIITNNGPINNWGCYPTWCRVGSLVIAGDVVAPTDGSFQAGLHWDYFHQDEWLITPAFNCPPNAWLSFDSYVFLGSIYGDHYYVKVSTDNGANWTVLWDASSQTGGWNDYSSPIMIDLGDYSENQLMIAFHAIDPPDETGLRYHWFIDNVYIGNGSAVVRFDPDAFTQVSAGREPGLSRPDVVPAGRSSTRVLTGYMVYRLRADHEHNEVTWVAVTDAPITELGVTDTGWAGIADGDYRWAVKAVYSGDVASVASFSNCLNNVVPTGMIVGMVKQTNNTPIPGATVTNGTVTATTNSQGAYILNVPVGQHSVSASAEGFQTQTVADVLVNHEQTTTLNFVLKQQANDDSCIPVVATALNGNYPNPFNPETTISYSVKEPGKVRLEVYNIKGQLVRTLVDEDQATGHYKLVFNARDDGGRSLASGVYLLRMVAPGYQKSSRMILMK